MENTLGGLNYNAPLSAEDYQWYQDLLENEILSRFLLSTGSPPNSTPQTGIVDILNPAEISPSETTRPYLVTVSTLNALNVAVNPGTAVTQTGALIQNSGNLSLQLAGQNAGDVNVVFVENIIVPSGQQVMNDYQDVLWTEQAQSAASLQTDLLVNWQNPSLYPASRQANIVVLAVVTVVQSSSLTLSLNIDLSQSTYTFNRPWFSIKDLQHRSYVGTGTVTTQNPHGTSFNDLSVPGSVGLFQGLASTGIVVSRDLVVNKMVGAVFCLEAIPLNRIQTDSTGNITQGSPYNRVGAKYVQLQAIPTRLGGVFVAGNAAVAVAAEVIGGTNLLVFAPDEPLDTDVACHYTDSYALLPPVQFPTNQLTFQQPTTGEVIVSQGLTLDTIPDPYLSMDGSGPISRIYRCYMQGTGALLTFPQILIPSTQMNIIGTTLYAPVSSMIAPARIQLGICKANAVAGMTIAVQIFGTDINGASINETLQLSTATGYQDLTVPNSNYDSSAQIATSIGIFASVTNIQVVTRTLDGPLTLLELWAAIEPGTAPVIDDYTPVCDIYWNGQGIDQIRDIRNLCQGFVRPQYEFMSSVGGAELESGVLLSQITVPPLLQYTSLHLRTEDIENLYSFDTSSGNSAVTPASGIISIDNNSYLTAGDTFTLKPGIVLTATASATPNLGAGEFQIGATAQTTQSNVIATVNYLPFNSGILASVGTGAAVNLSMQNPSGAFGNAFTITKSLTNGSAASIYGFSGGYDALGYCYLDRARIGLKSPVIPSPSTYDLSGYQYRGRYRCRAVGIPADQQPLSMVAVILHQMNRYAGYSVRIRGATSAAPGQWTTWAVMPIALPGVAGVFVYTFTQPVYKVQVEVYGTCRGVSIYGLVPN